MGYNIHAAFHGNSSVSAMQYCFLVYIAIHLLVVMR